MDIKKTGDVAVAIVVVRHHLIEKDEGLRPHRLKGVFGGMTTKVDMVVDMEEGLRTKEGPEGP